MRRLGPDRYRYMEKSMAKVVKLKPPQSATVELAEKLLADCKAGKVAAFAVATVSERSPYTGSASAVEAWHEGRDFTDGVMIHKLMLAAIEEMRHEFKHALRGG